MTIKPVLIIGGGLSGLACAMTLAKKRMPYILFEKKAVVGGRVATHMSSDGSVIDHGFQVLLNSYPELDVHLNLKALDLRKFNSGAMVFDGARMHLLANPILHPQQALSGLVAPMPTLADKALVLGLIAKSQSYRSDSERLGVTTYQFLRDFGFTDEFIEFFWRPFLAGVFLDESLENDAGFFLFLIRCFSLGSVTVPARGMNEIPKQMLSELDSESVRLRVGVASFDSKSVTLESGERIEGSAVVKAYPDLNSSGESFRSVVTHYFHVEKPLDWGKWLVLVPPKFGLNVNHLALMSEVAPEYSNSGRQLLSASVIGPKQADLSKVIGEIEQIGGKSLQLRHLESVVVRYALPKVHQTGEGFFKDPQSGVYYCGDSVASPSINGALRSGRLAAEFILKDLG